MAAAVGTAAEVAAVLAVAAVVARHRAVLEPEQLAADN